jgi:oligopeptide/dipeptide ABC transporter ATP-binding protein
LLSVRELRVSFGPGRDAVTGLTLDASRGEVVAIVGESGCGKSVTCLTILGLNPRAKTISTGEAIFNGKNLLELPTSELRNIRGNEISMIFQDPMTSLNPVHSIGKQLREAIQLHNKETKAAATRRALEMLKAVGIPRAETRLEDYPHQFSGGMRQRVMIAMALINNPDLLIADEPTTALDVTTQAQILKLMNDLQRDFGSAIIMITHDLGVVAETADEVLVMYAAKPAEQGNYSDIFYHAHHPYTWGLMRSLPRLAQHGQELRPIAGSPPSLLRPPPGCRFHLRCPYAMEICRTTEPAFESVEGTEEHRAACHLDSATQQAEAEKLVAETMASTG